MSSLKANINVSKIVADPLQRDREQDLGAGGLRLRPLLEARHHRRAEGPDEPGRPGTGH